MALVGAIIFIVILTPLVLFNIGVAYYSLYTFLSEFWFRHQQKKLTKTAQIIRDLQRRGRL